MPSFNPIMVEGYAALDGPTLILMTENVIFAPKTHSETNSIICLSVHISANQESDSYLPFITKDLTY